MNPNTETPADPDHRNRFRRGLVWLQKTGVGARGKKAKRLLHRRDRHTTRKILHEQTLA